MRRLHATALLFCLAGSLSTLDEPARAGDVAASYSIIVGPGTPVDDLDIDDLRRLFRGIRVDAGGQRLIPLNFRAGTKERVDFDRLLLKLSPDQAGRYWIDRKIRGEGEPPKSVLSTSSMKQLVAAVPGAVGYVRTDAVDRTVRVVKIDGLAPGAEQYPLRDAL